MADGPALGVSHTHISLLGPSAPDSKVIQRARKVFNANPRTDAGSPVGHRQIISPVTPPTRTAINYFLASLEG